MKDQCFLFENREGVGSNQGGGNTPTGMPILVRRTAAIGDALAASVVADKLAAAGYACEFQTHVNIHCLLKYQPNISRLDSPGGFTHVDLDGCYERNPGRRNLHFSEMFVAAADSALGPFGIDIGKALNCRPHLLLPRFLMESALAKFEPYPRPWIFLVPRSNTYAVRQVPDPVWQSAATKVEGTKFWMGTHPAPGGIIDLQVRHLDNIVVWLSVADLVITVDTGPMHIAAALNRKILALGQSSSPELHLSDQVDFETVWPGGNLQCLNCQENVCRINHYIPPCQSFDPELVAQRANHKLLGVRNGDVSAIISIYRPDAGMLNRCLESLLPQVQEIIICSDNAGIVPDGVIRHGKIKFVRHRQFDVGYGRKQNRAARESSGRYLLLLNDDVFLDPDAVGRMKEVFLGGHNVGMVSNLLRYPDGTIYHAGKIRGRGDKGWGHLNHRQHLPDLKDVTELENCCGACVMVEREAFYRIGGFDEEFYIYAEDDDFALRLRYAGYRIMFTPHSTGIHLEHQSTSKTGNLVDYLNKSNHIFGRKWGRYLEWNKDRAPMGNFDYLKA